MIEEYLQMYEANQRSKKTIEQIRYVLGKLDKFKPLGKIAREDLITFFKNLNGTDETKRIFQARIKKFYTDIGKPELVSWIKLIKIEERLKSSDILDTNDVNKMLEATDSPYWKAWIAFAFESGARLSEIKALKWKDFIETDDKGMVVDIPSGKTKGGYRKIGLPLSSGYIRNLKAHIDYEESDIVFPTPRQTIYRNLNKIASRANISKKVNPHMWRHASATDGVRRGFQESIIRKKHGWTKDSKMISRYISICDEDVVNEQLEKADSKLATEKHMPKIREAEKITLVDAAMQFSKLSEENEALKAEMETMKAMFNEDVLKSMIEVRVNEILKKS